MRFPLLQGYKYEIADTKLDARFTEDSKYVLSTESIPTKVETIARPGAMVSIQR